MGKCKHILDTARAEVPKAAHAAAEAAERPIRAAINCPVLLDVEAAPPVVDAAPAALQTLAGHNGAAPSPLSGRSDPEFFAMMRRMYLKP